MKFFVNKKSGFSSKDKLIVVYDQNGDIFYFKHNNVGLQTFNLPIGEYQTNNNLSARKPLDYRLFKLPYRRKVRNINLVEHFAENPNKASVDTGKNIAIYDNSFKDGQKVCFDFVKCHELGHFYFFDEGQKSEQQCDMFAYNMLIEYGYNPSQIIYAQKNTLSNNLDAQNRKNILYNHAKKEI